VKNPAKDLYRLFPARSEKTPEATSFDERASAALDYFASDLHDRDVIMMAEVYGSDFQRVWRKTRKKWWA